MENECDNSYYRLIVEKCADCIESETYGDFMCAYEELTELMKEEKETVKPKEAQKKGTVSQVKGECVSPDKSNEIDLMDLIKMFNPLFARGFDVDIIVRPAKSEDGKGSISVRYITSE